MAGKRAPRSYRTRSMTDDAYVAPSERKEIADIIREIVHDADEITFFVCIPRVMGDSDAARAWLLEVPYRLDENHDSVYIGNDVRGMPPGNVMEMLPGYEIPAVSFVTRHEELGKNILHRFDKHAMDMGACISRYNLPDGRTRHTLQVRDFFVSASPAEMKKMIAEYNAKEQRRIARNARRRSARKNAHKRRVRPPSAKRRNARGYKRRARRTSG